MRLLPSKISYRKKSCPDCGGVLRSVKFNFQKHVEGSTYRIVHTPGRVCDKCEGMWIWVERLHQLGIYDQVITEVTPLELQITPEK